jgi:uncharacterized protein YaeQ
MALTATIHHALIDLSDVDRGVYERLELTMARHPSESARYLVTRMIAYCLSYEPGIAFSKGGVSSADEPAVAVRDPTGTLTLWVEIGKPSAERLHKASKASRRVAVFSTVDRDELVRHLSDRSIHRAGEIDVRLLEPGFVSAIEARLARRMVLGLVQSDGRLYVTFDGDSIEGAVTRVDLGA